MSFKVTLAPSGHSFEVESGQKILNGGLAAGRSMPYGCRMGTCKSCRGRILSGHVDFGDAHPSYLTDMDREQGFALLCQAKALSDLVIEVKELPRLQPSREFPAIVRRVTNPAPDVAIVDLRMPLHEDLRYVAGQYLNILLPERQRRSYSIATPPSVPPEGSISIQLHIRHMPGGLFTDQVFLTGLLERTKLQLEAPLGTFFLRDDTEKPIIFLVSGTGYAPVRAILLDAFRSKLKRKMVLYWGGRTRRDLYLFDEPIKWASGHADFDFVPVLSAPDDDDGWMGRRGFVHQAVMEDFPDLSEYEVYACGAPAMVDAARTDFTSHRGLPADAFIADSFVTQADLVVAEQAGETQ